MSEVEIVNPSIRRDLPLAIDSSQVIDGSKNTENFPVLVNDNLLRAARGEHTDHTPVWIHRQAGRYLPEFRACREKADFFTLCQTPNLACEVTLQPLRRYNLDAAIIFSDILVIPQAMGMEVLMVKGKGPVLPTPLVVPSDMDQLVTLDKMDLQATLGYVFTAITLTRHNLNGLVPLIGFSGAPWTLMAYMIQGEGAKTYSKAKSWFYMYPEASHKLLGALTDLIVEYLILQVKAGAQMLEVFDSWAGDLTPEVFDEFVFPTLKAIASRVKQGLRDQGLDPVPMTIFPRGAHFAFKQLAEDTEYDVISVDWAIRPADVRVLTGTNITLQGNLDSSIFFASDQTIVKETEKMVEGFGAQRYIANLGHGMLPSHEPRAVETFVEAVHDVSKRLNAAATQHNDNQ